MSVEREINEYLFYEFGHDGEYAEDRISESWPFKLEYLESFEEEGGETRVYQFEHDNEAFYVLYGGTLGYFSQAGIGLRHLKYELAGSRWLSREEPITLEHVILGDPKIPSTKDRLRAIEKLADKLGKGKCKVLEGLFLPKSNEYLSLVTFGDEEKADIVGTRITLRGVPFPQASPYRRLAIGIGLLLSKGDLS